MEVGKKVELLIGCKLEVGNRRDWRYAHCNAGELAYDNVPEAHSDVLHDYFDS